MSTTKSKSIMRIEDKRELVQLAADKIKSFGYDVWVMDDRGFVWGIFSNGDTVAYFQSGEFFGISVSSKHKPMSNVGSGINVADNINLDQLTPEICEDALRVAPNWWRRKFPKQASRIRKYTMSEFWEDANKRGLNYVKV